MTPFSNNYKNQEFTFGFGPEFYDRLFYAWLKKFQMLMADADPRAFMKYSDRTTNSDNNDLSFQTRLLSMSIIFLVEKKRKRMSP